MDKTDFIFGLRPVMEAMEAGKNIDKILFKRELTGELAKQLLETAKKYGIYCQRVPQEKLNRITLKNHQGVIAITTPIRYQDLENVIINLYENGKNPMGILLDGVTDARNFGAIARSAECAGADFIIIPEHGSASATSDAVRASAGALFHLPVCRVKDISTAVGILQSNGIKVVGASEKSSEDYTKIDLTVPISVVMGSEDKGISNDVIRKCDNLASIPIKGKVGSLNVSVAAGIMLYEIVRQRSGL